MAMQEIKDAGKKILKERKYSNHVGDAHLTLVLAATATEYVTWGFNKEDGGFFWGHYFPKTDQGLTDANDDFETRGK